MKPFLGKPSHTETLEQLRETQAELEQLKIAHETLRASDKKKSLYLYSILKANLPGVTFSWMNKDGLVLGCNYMLAMLFGLRAPEELIGKDIYYLGKLHGWETSVCDRIRSNDLQVMESGKTIIYEEELPLGGEKRFFLSYKTPLQSETGEIFGVFGFSVDITTRKKREIVLQRAFEIADTANEAKTEFIRNMSHDLRTPLAGIIGIADLICNHSDSRITKQDAGDIHQAGLALMNLLNEIIDTAKLESGKIMHQKSCFSLKETLDDLTTIFMPSINQKGLKLDIQYDNNIPSDLYGEALLFHRIILNLLGNAVKFTQKGTITVSASLMKKSDTLANVKLSVKDTGIGISDEKLSSLFHKMTRPSLTSTNGEKKSQLGLFMVKQFIEKLGGDIKATSTLDKGSEFVCTVPFKIATKEQVEQLKQHKISKGHASMLLKDGAKKKTRVLLVEDTLLPRRVATNMLADEGFDVVTAETAAEAIAESNLTKFDLIYMDLGLPDGSGIDVTKAIRQHAENPNQHTFIAAFTAFLDPEIQKSCFEAGIQETFEKPLTEEIIEKTRESMLKYLSGDTSEKSTRANLTALPILDMAFMTKVIGNHPDMIKEILTGFIKEDLPEFQQNMHQAFQDKDWPTLKKQVHKLHGALCYIGAMRLKEATAALEQQLATQSGSYDEPYNNVLSEIETAITEYHKLS